MKFILAGNGLKLACVQAVDADVQRGNSGVAPGSDIARQAITVGGDRHGADSRIGAHRRNNVGEIPPQQRFAAGQADLFGPQFGAGAGNAADFVQRQKAAIAGSLRTITIGQAIGAAKITDVRH